MTTIIDYLEKHKQNSPEKIFIQFDSQNWTYEDIYNKVNKISLILNQFPKNSIIFQSEDLDKSTGWMLEGERGSRYIELLNEYKVIDYAEFNLQSDIIKHKNKKFLPFLYCEDLKFKFKK